MALTVAVVQSLPGNTFANATVNFVVAVTNTGSSSVALNGLSVNASAGDPVSISQPSFLVPNVPVNVGNPSITAGATSYFPFQAVFRMPINPGPSPQNPGGAAPFAGAYPADPFYFLTAIAQASDGSVGTGSVFVPVLSTLAQPVASGGAFQWQQGFNLINGIVLGTL